MKDSDLLIIKKNIGDSFMILHVYGMSNIKMINKISLTMENILLTKNFTFEEEKELYDFMVNGNMLIIFQKMYEVFETSLETRFARMMITKKENLKDDFTKYLLYNRFSTLVANEIDLAAITADDKVLFIGSGPIPISAILIHELSGAFVDCVERYKPSADLSLEVIHTLGYSDSIHVVNKEGVDIDYSQYSVILIALLAKPKDELLKSIWSQVSIGARVICRTSNLVRQAFYETTEESLIATYNPIGKVIARGDQTISSILLVRD